MLIRSLKKIKVTYVHYALLAILVVTAVFLLVGIYRTAESVREMQVSTERYIDGQMAAEEMHDASNLLSETSKDFSVTGNPEMARRYFEEIEVKRSREEALQVVLDNAGNAEEAKNLSAALEKSNELAEVEIYAMRLAAEGYEIDPKTISPTLAAVELTDGDGELSHEEQIDRSRQMLFGESYNEMLLSIRGEIASSLDSMIGTAKGRQEDSYYKAKRAAREEFIIIILSLLAAFLAVLFSFILIIRPIRNSTRAVANSEALSLAGSQEYLYLAEAYNSMLEKTQRRQQELSYEATHDPLTGLHNRKVFDVRREELAEEDAALLIIDVDKFKEINDVHGHMIGDRALKRIAAVLNTSFRHEDLVCRTGGDEFIVIMKGMTPKGRSVVESKISLMGKRLAERLREDEDELPEITLSIGIAFNEGRDADDLYRKADEALYRAKQAGRNRHCFYGSEECALNG